MEFYRFLKLFGAVLLLISMLLPLSSCATDTGRDYTSAIDILKPLEITHLGWWIIMTVFAWPIVFIGILMWQKTGRLALLLRIIEPLGIYGSIYFISEITMYERLEEGFYLAAIALATYAAGSVWEDISTFRRWRRKR